MQYHSYRLKLILPAVMSLVFTAVVPSQSNSADSTVSIISQFIERGVSGYTVETRAEILEHYGPPNRTEVKLVRNIHYPTFLDRIHTLYYDGLVIKTYEAVLPGQEFVIAIFLSGNKYPLVGGLSIGMTGAHIIRTLGRPTIATDSLLIYDEMHTGEGRVCFKMDGDVVRNILWEYYFD